MAIDVFHQDPFGIFEPHGCCIYAAGNLPLAVAVVRNPQRVIAIQNILSPFDSLVWLVSMITLLLTTFAACFLLTKANRKLSTIQVHLLN